jgi:hypothetical protein
VAKASDGKTITSIDSKRAYLSILDFSSRYSFIFKTVSKTPPIGIVHPFLSEHGQKDLKKKQNYPHGSR